MRRLFVFLTILLLVLPLPVMAANPVYLPFVARGGINPDGSIPAPNAYNFDVFNLPKCGLLRQAQQPNGELVEPSAPDFSDHTACQLETHIDGFPTGDTFGLLRQAQQPVGELVEPSDIFLSGKSAGYILNCSTCTTANGLTSIQGNLSSQYVYLPNSSWHNYFWGNRIGLVQFGSNITCQTGASVLPTMRVGLGLGRATGDIAYTSRTIIGEITAAGYCYTVSGNQMIGGDAAPFFTIYKDADSGSISYWTAAVWLGTWVTVFAHFAMPINASANGAFAGQVINAVNNDYGNFIEYTNFTHKLEILPKDVNAYRSWALNAAPSRMLGSYVTTYADSPFNVMDLVGGDYTSISSTINY